MEPAHPSSCLPEGGEKERLPIPAGRSDGRELESEIGAINSSTVVEGLLEAVHGLMGVLNENRQLLAINDRLLQTFGVSSVKAVLGLRLGEAVHCLHAEHAPGGCGTTEFCQNCGAAIAQVTALNGVSCEQLCAIEIPGDDTHENLFFRVRASPLTIGQHKYILLFLQDVSQEQRVAALEQVFLHDLRNTAMGIEMGSALLAESSSADNAVLARDVLHLATRLTREIELQRCLGDSSLRNFQCQLAPLSLTFLFDELQRACRHHPAMAGHRLTFSPPPPDRTIATDLTILHRVLYNMIINALEASGAGGDVKVSSAHRDNHVIFSVWNAGAIPVDISRRIFQRNFSTKSTLGHGLGTYSMKLLGEKLLGGRVSFASTPEAGTTFKIELRA